jgi:hypothetical protein
MGFRFLRVSLSLLFIFSFSFLAFSYDLEANINSGNIPIPPGSEKVDSSAAPVPIGQAAAYTTSLDKDQLLSFFRTKLRQKNWSQAESLFDDLKSSGAAMPGFAFGGQDIPISQQEALESVFQFRKGQTQLMLIVMPKKITGDKAVFALTAIETGAESFEQLGRPFEEKSEFRAKSIPAYPKSREVYSDKSSIVFSTEARPKDVISYYKTTMPGRGWHLKEEEPLRERKVQPSLSELKKLMSGLSLDSAGEYPGFDNLEGLEEELPDEVKKQMEEGYTVSEGELTFSDSQGNRCLVTVSSSQGGNALPDETSIHIMHRRGLKIPSN